MAENYDIVVVGSGHNGLTAAAYLASAGLSVKVLEKNEFYGGGVVTREVTAPGFKHDLHSTGHIFIQANPLILNDELGLKSDFGLEYVNPEAYFGCVFEDGSSLVTYTGLDKTCAAIAEHSKRDAVAYHVFVEKCQRMLTMFTMGLFNPPSTYGAFMAVLDQSPEGRDVIGEMHRSAYDIIMDLFENEKVRMHFLKWAGESMQGPEVKGTGINLYLMCGMTHTHPNGLPVGGSGALSDSLVRCIEHHGGEVSTGCNVMRLLKSGNRATGVVLDDGTEYHAKRAVIGCIHPHLLNDFVGGDLEDTLQANLSRVQPASYSAMNTHYALKEAPVYKAGGDVGRCFAVETHRGGLRDMREMFDEFRYGRVPKDLSLLSICNSNHDPSRAPNGQATLYLYHFMPFDLEDGGSAQWDVIKDEVADRLLEELQLFTTNMGSDNIIARHVESPLDFVRHTPSMQHGDILGAGMYLDQILGRRPIPEVADYTVDGLESFYLCGPFMHPGGGVIGGGRPVAIKMMSDMGLDFQSAIANQ